MAQQFNSGDEYAAVVLSALETGTPLSTYGIRDARPDVARRHRKERTSRFRAKARMRYFTMQARIAEGQATQDSIVRTAAGLFEIAGYEVNPFMQGAVQISSSVYEWKQDKHGFPTAVSWIYQATLPNGLQIECKRGKLEQASALFLSKVMKASSKRIGRRV